MAVRIAGRLGRGSGPIAFLPHLAPLDAGGAGEKAIMLMSMPLQAVPGSPLEVIEAKPPP
jgi:hypothetical protein